MAPKSLKKAHRRLCAEEREIQECIDWVAYDAEMGMGPVLAWQMNLGAVFENRYRVRVQGEEIVFEGFELNLQSTALTAVCTRNRQRICVPWESLEWLNPTPLQKLWWKAWKKWNALA